MTLSFRIFTTQYETDAQFARLLELLSAHRGAVDEVSLFTEYWHHGYFPLDKFGERAEVLGRRVAQLHEAGFKSVGINMLATIGHLDEAWDFLPPLDAGGLAPMIGHDGAVARASMCPNAPQNRAYIKEKYRLIARQKPDFIWVDDDLRLGHHARVQWGCFCPLCLAQLEQGDDRAAVVEQLGHDAALRRQWLEHNVSTIEDLMCDIAAAVHEVDAGIEIGFMSSGTDWQSYSGEGAREVYARWMGALGGKRMRPGCGFYEDSKPRDMLQKALMVGRQCAAMPPTVDNIQYELENFPYQKLGKSVHTVLNECSLALGVGCNGIAFNALKDLPGSLDDYRDLMRAVASHQPAWREFVEASRGTTLVGAWPASPSGITDDGNWLRGNDYELGRPNALWEIGLPFTTGPAGARLTLLSGRIAAVFSDDELRAMLTGGVLLDVAAWHVLEERGLGEHCGVRPAKSYDNGLWERFSTHPLNGQYCGEGRDARLSFNYGLAWQLEATGENVQDMAHLVGYDDSDCGMCLSAFENNLGGRVVTAGYAPWSFLNNSAKRSQILALCDWASRGTLPLVIDKTLRVTPLVRQSEDGKRVAMVLLNTSFDETGEFEVTLRAAPAQVRLLSRSGETPLAARKSEKDTIVTVPDLAPWRAALIIGEN